MGGNFNIREGKSGWTCLHHAIASFRTDVVHILTTVIRVDVNVRSYSGKTALESAASYSRRLQASNSTALSAAIRSIVILLIEAGANKHDFNCLSSEDESDSDSDTYFSEEEREE
jgi:ankyrin repeat protein